MGKKGIEVARIAVAFLIPAAVVPFVPGDGFLDLHVMVAGAPQL